MSNQSMSGIESITDGVAVMEDGTLTCINIVCSNNITCSEEIDTNNLAVIYNGSIASSLAVGDNLVVGQNIINSGTIYTKSINLNGTDLQTLLNAIILKIGGV